MLDVILLVLFSTIQQACSSLADLEAAVKWHSRRGGEELGQRSLSAGAAARGGIGYALA